MLYGMRLVDTLKDLLARGHRQLRQHMHNEEAQERVERREAQQGRL